MDDMSELQNILEEKVEMNKKKWTIAKEEEATEVLNINYPHKKIIPRSISPQIKSLKLQIFF